MDVGQAQPILGSVGLREQRGALDIGCQDGVQHRDLAARRVLRDRADAGPAHQVDVAGIGLVLTLDDLQQGRFACAIAADQTDLPAVGKGRRGAVEQHPLAVAEGKIGDTQHGGGGV